jgi:hypothetical protein
MLGMVTEMRNFWVNVEVQPSAAGERMPGEEATTHVRPHERRLHRAQQEARE